MARHVKKKAKPRRFRILPMTLTMLSLLLALKLNDIYFDVKTVREAHAADREGAAKAEDEQKKVVESKSEHGDEAKKEEGGHTEEAKDGLDYAKEGEEGHKEAAKEDGGHGGGEVKPPEEPKTAGKGKSTIKEIEALKEKQAQPLYTKNELDLLQNLTKRRQELEKREQELELKSKVLEATEKRIGDKVTEMKTLEAELGKVVAEYNAQQNNQLASLVKIYENMKPSDAAQIFGEMEMPILLDVIGRMSERKVAPILANMDPKKARDVTQELAEIRRAQAAKSAATLQATK